MCITTLPEIGFLDGVIRLSLIVAGWWYRRPQC